MHNVVTPQMLHHATTRAHDHFGFTGKRAAIACLYARPGGATQDEVNRAATGLDSPQEGWFNMLHQAKKWGTTSSIGTIRRAEERSISSSTIRLTVPTQKSTRPQTGER
jgi:hypothetical protein